MILWSTQQAQKQEYQVPLKLVDHLYVYLDFSAESFLSLVLPPGPVPSQITGNLQGFTYCRTIHEMLPANISHPKKAGQSA